MLGARLIEPAAMDGGKPHLRSPPSPSASSLAAAETAGKPAAQAARRPRRSSPAPLLNSLDLPLVALTLPPDFADRLLVGFFGATVIGQLYTWPLALFLLASLTKAALRGWREGGGGGAATATTAALAPAFAALALLLYLCFILGRGFREAEVTPNELDVVKGEDQDQAAAGPPTKRSSVRRSNKWWSRAPLRSWPQWARLRRHTAAKLVRAGPPLDPGRSYVFAGYPHGISAISAFANLVVDPPREDEEEEEEQGPVAAPEQEAQSRRPRRQQEEEGPEAPPSSSGASDDGAVPAPPPPPTTQSGSFRALFPGITMHAMTLASNFKAPLVREYCLSLGLRPATRSACAALLTEPCCSAAAAAAAGKEEEEEEDNDGEEEDGKEEQGYHQQDGTTLRHRRPPTTTTTTLQQQKKPTAAATPSSAPTTTFRPSPGRAIFLSPGGAAEALLSRPGGQYDLVLARRKGFCRVAVATGSDVVPVLMFGETELFDVWHPPQGSRAWRLQRLSHRLFGTSQPVFSGEGLLGAHVKGLLPKRWLPGSGRPRLTTVVGQPVRVEGGSWGGAGAAGHAGGGGDKQVVLPAAASAADRPPSSFPSPSSSSSSWPPRIPKRGADPAFEQAVDALHGRYVAALKELFDQYAPLYHPGAVLRLADGEEEEASGSKMHH
jgi:hypothetical protein